MSTRDEMLNVIPLVIEAVYDNTAPRGTLDYTRAANRVIALLDPLLSAPPAPGEVRLTLSREGAEWWRDVIDKADCWGSEHEAARVLDALTAALDAAAAPEQK